MVADLQVGPTCASGRGTGASAFTATNLAPAKSSVAICASMAPPAVPTPKMMTRGFLAPVSAGVGEMVFVPIKIKSQPRERMRESAPLIS